MTWMLFWNDLFCVLGGVGFGAGFILGRHRKMQKKLEGLAWEESQEELMHYLHYDIDMNIHIPECMWAKDLMPILPDVWEGCTNLDKVDCQKCHDALREQGMVR